MSKCLKSTDQEISNLKGVIACLKHDLRRLHIDFDIMQKVCKKDEYKILYLNSFSNDDRRKMLEKEGYFLKAHFDEGTIELWVKKECYCQEDEDEDEDCGE